VGTASERQTGYDYNLVSSATSSAVTAIGPCERSLDHALGSGPRPAGA
jgi:hypothetical protein